MNRHILMQNIKRVSSSDFYVATKGYRRNITTEGFCLFVFFQGHSRPQNNKNKKMSATARWPNVSFISFNFMSDVIHWDTRCSMGSYVFIPVAASAAFYSYK